MWESGASSLPTSHGFTCVCNRDDRNVSNMVSKQVSLLQLLSSACRKEHMLSISPGRILGNFLTSSAHLLSEARRTDPITAIVNGVDYDYD
jgi:hypothetical protein